jgi:hypothetical protein
MLFSSAFLMLGLQMCYVPSHSAHSLFIMNANRTNRMPTNGILIKLATLNPRVE